MPTSVTRLNLFFIRFLEPARVVFVFFEVFSGGFILLELEMMNFVPIIFNFFFRGAGFANYLRMFARFLSICKIWE